jgi:hypothetical protein
MEKLIPLISDLQDIIRKSDVNLEISLPMIAVVGSQSTGKSFNNHRQKLSALKYNRERIFTQRQRNCNSQANINSACANPG